MKITIDRTPDNVKLLKLMADKNPLKALEARQAFAEFITAPVLEVIESAPVIQSLFTTRQFDYGTPSSIPLDPLFDIRDNDFIRVWPQSRPGGLVSSQNQDVSELMVMTYPLFSAVEFDLQYLRAARVDVVAAYMERMMQEFLYKQEINSFNILGAAVTQGTFTDRRTGANVQQVIRSQTQGSLLPQDVSRMVTRMARANSSWVGGTPTGQSRAITTLVGSPEFLQEIREMAFEPLNVTASTYPLGGPDKFRDDIYAAGEKASIYGMELMSVYDMGQGYPYNIVAGTYAGSTAYQGYAQTGTAVFSPGSEQLVVGVDRRRPFLVRLVENDPDTNSTVTVSSDDQYPSRAKKVGFTAEVKEGRVSLDARNVVGILF